MNAKEREAVAEIVATLIAKHKQETASTMLDMLNLIKELSTTVDKAIKSLESRVADAENTIRNALAVLEGYRSDTKAQLANLNNVIEEWKRDTGDFIDNRMDELADRVERSLMETMRGGDSNEE